MRVLRKKSLGQYFLRSEGALRKIVAAAHLTPGETVLEVGPGEGVLTARLLGAGARVVAVEKDARLIPLLQEKFFSEITSGRLTLIQQDILLFNPLAYQLLAMSYKLVANLPYYITGAFLKKFLSTQEQPSRMVLLLQKEVAKRIIAADGKESILSISVKAYGMPHYIDTVKAGSFSPPPKVDSAIIAIENISRNLFADVAEEEKFFALLKKGFSKKRKLLRSVLGVSLEVFEHCGISTNARPENLTRAEWKCLAANKKIEQ